jgi:1-acyl-sn-glycerol-3-phosphate acyltransferase
MPGRQALAELVRPAPGAPSPEAGPRRRKGAPTHGPVVLAIYNAIYWPYLFITCALLFVPALVIFACTFWDRRHRALSWYTSAWGAHYLSWAPLAGTTVEGREHAPCDRPCVYVSNHQSMVDILAVFATRLPFKWVSKVENFYAPFLGWNMLLNRYVPLKRGHLPSIMKMVRACNARVREGHSLFVFPEGTRSPDGELKSFYRGAFAIATRNRVPVVPMLIEGTGDILPKGTFCIRPRPVLIRILPPLDPAAFGFDARRLKDAVHAQMLEAQAQIRN